MLPGAKTCRQRICGNTDTDHQPGQSEPRIAAPKPPARTLLNARSLSRQIRGWGFSRQGWHVVGHHAGEVWNIPAAGKINANAGVASVCIVVLRQCGTQPRRFDAHDRVNRGIEICWTAEHIDRDRIRLDRLGPALEVFGCDEAEKIFVAFGRLKASIRQQPVNLGLRLGLIDMFAE
ncbi:hypothetical protein [Pararhizobium sp. DWP3-4]|uniref:hypothetical protein n=1 Tax=Pararhizobium sp. DWP3-4 TaxID=2804565 RepID=UPI003CF2D7FF